jgi:hypothetical protein
VIDGSSRRFLRTRGFRLALALCSLTGGLLFAGAPALALSSFPTGVAVDNSASSSQDPSPGYLYVATEEGKLIQLNAADEFVTEFSLPETGSAAAVAVDSSGTASTGNVYVSQGDVVYELSKLRSNGGPFRGEYEIVRELTGLSKPSALAVDAAGNLYVEQPGAGNVLEFSSTGEPLNAGKPVVEGLSGTQGIAVDAHGDLYVAGDMGTVEFIRADGGLSTPKTIDPNGSSGVAVDSSTGAVYLLGPSSCIAPGGDSFSVEELESSGNLVTLYGCVDGDGIALAESEATKTVYVASSNFLNGLQSSKLWAFVPKPVVLREASTEVSMSGATVSGMVAAGSEPTHYRFEYGTTTSYEAQTPTREMPASISDVEDGPEGLGGLLPDTEYHYRLIVENETGIVEGEDSTFKTLALPPASTGAAQDSGQEMAQVLGQTSATQVVTTVGDVGLSPEKAVPSPRALTNAQRLTRALKACEKKPKDKRAVCDKQARKQYGTTSDKRGRQIGKRRRK